MKNLKNIEKGIISKVKYCFPKSRVLIILVLLALLLRFPWLYTTIEKDEGSFGYVAWRMLSGEKLYVDLPENKPPFLFILYAIPIYFFGNTIIPIRLLNNVLFMISVIFFFKLTKNIFSQKKALFSTLFYIVFMNIPVFEGYLATSESVLTPFLIVSVYLFNKYISKKECYLLLSSAIFAIAALSIKQHAIFLYFLLIMGLFIYKEGNKIKELFIILFPLIFGFILIMFFNQRLILTFLQKVWETLTKYSWGFSSGYRPLMYNLQIIMEGSLLWLFAIIGAIIAIKTKADKRYRFVFFWVIFALIFTVLPPAYGHYYLLSVPPLSIFAGIGMGYAMKSKQDKRLFTVLITLLILLTGALVIKCYPDSRLSLGPFQWGWSSLESYQQQVFLANSIKNMTSPEDKIFIWGFESSIYWLSERKSSTKIYAHDCDFPKSLNNANITVDEWKKRVYSNSKAIILIPGFCDSLVKRIFSDLAVDYSKTKVGNFEVYVKN